MTIFDGRRGPAPTLNPAVFQDAGPGPGVGSCAHVAARPVSRRFSGLGFRIAQLVSLVMFAALGGALAACEVPIEPAPAAESGSGADALTEPAETDAAGSENEDGDANADAPADDVDTGTNENEEVGGSGDGDADVDEDGSGNGDGDEGAQDGEVAVNDGADESVAGADTQAEAEADADAGGAGAAEPAGSSDDRRPAPGDMLTADEQSRALDLALGAEFVQTSIASAVDRDDVLQALSEDGDATAEDARDRVAALAQRPSYRVLYSERYPDKEAVGRAAEVSVYRYDTGQPLRARIDLDTGEVEALSADGGGGMPLVRAEIEEGAVVARADEAVLEAMREAGLDPGTAAVNGLLTGTADEGSACFEHRCVRLFFSSFERPAPQFSVVVDLVALNVVDVHGMPGTGGTWDGTEW